MQNSLLMTRLYSLLSKINRKVLMFSIMIYPQSPKWDFNWKILINLDTNKPAQEVLFSRKKKNQNHPDKSLNYVQVERVSHPKHLGIIFDEKLIFKKHIDSTILKANRGIIKKTQI